MCTRASVSVCVCVFVIVPFSLAAGAATPGQAGGESERGVGGAAAGETVWYMRLSLATLRHTRIRRFNKDITQTK